jgi:cell division protein FtsW (lipid II flippase)
VSYGGSSLVASWLAAGLILNVSAHEVERAEA